jgi:hypothetical protein
MVQMVQVGGRMRVPVRKLKGPDRAVFPLWTHLARRQTLKSGFTAEDCHRMMTYAAQ